MEGNIMESTENEEIKSTAVVKYSLPKLAPFTKLQCNTDLNLPPSNWLSSSADSYGLQHVLTHPKGFSSFKMAHMFPDCVGEVDVVSDAENIKKLLKIPYHKKGHISMMVHRIENTLLIDDFDIYKHLLRTAETEWEWLRKFFVDNISRATYEENKHIYINSRRREALKEKSLVSKFLYHSLVPTEKAESSNLLETNTCQPVKDPLLPEPSPSAECPDSPTSAHKYNTNVLWTFEDIEMLLGTDMPIFGGGTHPCISLRLRDMNKPISVLTGIDYWLDNLMSNVPEVIMCYHLNGIVQKYELVKTEDLPRMDNSKFSPKLIRDVAQSILSFLKSNATKSGHTYWLFKGKDEEVIKLYDLTSLCSEKDVEKGQNPFTIPVAMLLYRVARNMKHSSERPQPGTIRTLLKNCIKLLPQEKYPEIVTSSLYMLSDLYVPANTNPESHGLDENDTDDDNETLYEDDLSDDENSQEETMKVLVLENNRFEKFKNYYKPPAPIVGGVEERCQQAIQHVAAGLDCIKYFSKNKEERSSGEKDEEEVKMAKPYEPIPMPYGKINETKTSTDSAKKNKKKERKKKSENKNQDKLTNALLPKNLNEAQPLPTWQEKENRNISWKDHLKTLLYEKAVLIYAILSEHHFVQGNYGLSLKYIGLLARCQLVMNKLQYASNALRENCLLGRAGDCCIMMIQNWGKCEIYNEQLHNNQHEDFKMMEQLEQDEQFYNISIGNSEMRCVFLFDIRTIEQMLLKSIECYETALKLSESDNILRRLANSLNEIGSYYLNRAKVEKNMNDIVQTCKKADNYLARGLELFERVKDTANVALLYTNIGHLYRLLAHANTPVDRGEITQQEKIHYNKAIINYKKALQVLGERENCPGIWDAVKWELSTALFNMGWIMHENPSIQLSKTEAEKEVIETLQKALQYCDFDEKNPKYPLYIYRAAIIHYRIGSLYHSHIWSTPNDSSNRKNIIQLAKINYEKASKMYFQSSDAINYFTSQMQRFALSEYLTETTSALHTKIKHLQHCLEIVLELEEMIDLIMNKKVEIQEVKEEEKTDTRENNFKSCYSLLKLVATRLQHVLKLLVKYCLTKPPPNKDCEKMSELYKKCYKLTFDLKDNLSYSDLLRELAKVLLSIKSECEIYNNKSNV